MKVILIDDEKAMHIIMTRMLAKLDDKLEVAGCFTDTASAYAYLTSHEVDLVFVDISMPRESGLAFAGRLRDAGKHTRLVFVTSHKQYALTAFDVYAFDYIVKPIGLERLGQTIKRAMGELQAEVRLAEKAEAAAPDIRFNCLGGMDIQSAQGLRAKWKSSKSMELFGYLLLHRGRLVSRARLIEDMFGDMPLKNAEVYLNTTVYQLRKVLQSFGLKESLISDSYHYALNLNEVKVDLFEFEAGCRALSMANEQQVSQAIQLEQLYAGNLFGDHAYAWAAHEVERIAIMYASFTRSLSAALLERGDAHLASLLLRKLMSNNELDEEALALLMKAWAAQKNKEALTSCYKRFTETLYRDIGVKSSRESEDLYNKLLLQLDA
ncbi:response regulator [Paenibacillus sp. PL2-23]|uniref:response regulator n=1 Tax=Paenibacillus sp. PL2-23 TaxID=2100729 RepID=UPI0030FB19E6